MAVVSCKRDYGSFVRSRVFFTPSVAHSDYQRTRPPVAQRQRTRKRGKIRPLKRCVSRCVCSCFDSRRHNSGSSESLPNCCQVLKKSVLQKHVVSLSRNLFLGLLMHADAAVASVPGATFHLNIIIIIVLRASAVTANRTARRIANYNAKHPLSARRQKRVTRSSLLECLCRQNDFLLETISPTRRPFLTRRPA